MLFYDPYAPKTPAKQEVLYKDMLITTGNVAKYFLIICTVKDTKTEKNDFVLECSLPKNKKSKDTFSTPHRDLVLTLMHRFKSVIIAKDKKFYVTKWTKSTQVQPCILIIFARIRNTCSLCLVRRYLKWM